MKKSRQKLCNVPFNASQQWSIKRVAFLSECKKLRRWNVYGDLETEHKIGIRVEFPDTTEAREVQREKNLFFLLWLEGFDSPWAPKTW